MSFQEIIDSVFSDPTTNAALTGIVVLGLLEWGTGTLRAIADKTFQLSLLDTWVRTQLAGRILPVALVLIVGEAAPSISFGDFSFSIVTAAGLAAAAGYAAGAAKSIIDNLNKGAADPLPIE